MSSEAASAGQRRVLLTRSDEDCADWAQRFAQHGVEPVVLPCIRVEPISTPALKAQLAAALPRADWLVLTSRRGVEALVALVSPLPALKCRVAVVGAATAAAAKAALGRVDLVAEPPGTAAGLAAALVERGELERHPRVLLAVAANAGDVIERTLRAAGAECTRLDVYETVPAPRIEPRHALSALHVDNVVLASPSAVTGFVQQVDVDVPANVYTIGPSTSAAARRAGLAVTGEAREPSLEGILEAMRWRS